MAYSQPLSSELSLLITEDFVTKLKEIGITSVGKLISHSPDVVSKLAPLPHDQVKAIHSTLLRRFGPCPISGRTLLEEAEENMCIFPFGSSSIDSLLKGGVYTGELTEIWGPTASGKTQLCLQLTSQVVACSRYTVAYVDGGGAFSPTRLEQLLVSRGISNSVLPQIMEKVRVFKVFSAFDLISLISSFEQNVTHQTDSYYANLRLLIIDPVTFYLAPMLGGQYSQGKNLMIQVATALRVLSHNHFIAIVYCNNVVSGIGGELKPALGQTWSSIPSSRFHVCTLISPTKPHHDLKLLTISKSPRQMIGVNEKFSITATGIDDAITASFRH